tara:strand:+ start:171 stop:335 length:165 start_codon:yes stop_codon:yes gene_type:complete
VKKWVRDICHLSALKVILEAFGKPNEDWVYGGCIAKEPEKEITGSLWRIAGKGK